MRRRKAGSVDVAAVGNALVDVFARAGDELIAELGLSRGAMTLVSSELIERAGELLRPEKQVSGGSAANTAVGVASLGGRAAFVGRVDRDALGKIFTDHINDSGVLFRHHAPDREVPVNEGPMGRGTGRCFVVVTPDAERTMATYLGVASQLDDEDIDEDLVSSARVTYLEGYLWDLRATKEALRHAARVSHGAGNLVAISLSDPFVVERHRAELTELLETRHSSGDHVDIVFGNEEEVKLLYGSDSFDDAAERLASTGVMAVLTRGAFGSVVLRGPERREVAAMRRSGVVDTTGAGDLFAAGFLTALTRGHPELSGDALVAGADLERCGALGSLAAAEVISHIGSRPIGSLAKLAADEGLLDA